MSIHHRSHVTASALSLLLAGSVVACAGSHAGATPPQSASATSPTAGASGASGASSAGASSGGQNAQPAGAPNATGAHNGSAGAGQDDEDDAELVVSRDVVARCPKLRAVRQHVAEFDPDMVWLAVLESLGECMGQGGPMAEQTIGVSGDEEHRHVVREVLGSRGVAPTRVIATPVAGAAECQGGADCSKRVEITIAPTSP
ncbi:MAG TPA: hypothetical protein VK762_14175 [Polyangiaceae bacterium]|jgi:hypothetical protein|nr:hypothetical protein [Polyangiaceae bacterium]